MKILIVDDEAVSMEKLKTLLAPFGDCDTATSGEDGVEKVKAAQIPYMLITMDISMPGMGGQAAVEAIRSWESAHQLAGAKILMVTSSQDMSAISSSVKAGCDGYLFKPFTDDSVKQALEALGVRPRLGLKLKPPEPT